MRKVHYVSRSKDPKVGDVVVSYSPKSSCPTNCPLLTGGCYAWSLFYLNLLGSKIDNGKIKLKSLTAALLERSKESKIVRHRVAGDIVGDVQETLEDCMVIKGEGLINIGYSHYWKTSGAQPLKEFFRASCQNLSELEEARKAGWAATLMVPIGTPKTLILKNNEKAFMCPARHGVKDKKDITCNDCTLCRVDDKTRNKTVMFEIHGSASTLKKLGGKVGSIS